jgi:hypothetical protein
MAKKEYEFPNKERRMLSDKAGKIAVDHLGAFEVKPFAKPAELKKLPPEIIKPIVLKTEPIIIKSEVKADVKTKEPVIETKVVEKKKTTRKTTKK